MKHLHPKKCLRIAKETLHDWFWYYLLPDSVYLKIRYKQVFGKKLNLKNPQTFNEKIQWLKLHDRNPEYHKMVDKYEAKKYVSKKIGNEYIIPTIGVYEGFSDIDFGVLPDQFVMKCTHDASSYVICVDKSKLDIKAAELKLTKALKQDYYHYQNKQWVYKSIKPRIIVENFIKDSDTIELGLTDYKFFCYDGEADCVMVALDRETNDTKFYFFDKQWNLLRYNYRGINAPSDFSLPKPEKLDEMFRIASILSQGIPFVRVDLYLSCGKIYFGEMTFNPDGGMDNLLLPETDLLFGQKIKINN